MKRVLMVAYHFPPLAGSSGIQRTLRFVRHLPQFGWEPIVLTAHPRAYERTSADLLRDVPEGTVVERAFALDTARHLSLAGRYPAALARPDRWRSWRLGAVPAGLALIRRHRPDLVWSTYPIATAHVIGSALNRRSGLPWVADFRDPMAQDGYPPDPKTWQSFKRIEEDVFRHAAASTFTTPGAVRYYRQRYPAVDPARMVLIENGYDEESFPPEPSGARRPLVEGALTLLHSGLLYPVERDPTQLFAAVRKLVDEGRATPATLRLRFRAAAHEDFAMPLVERYGLQAMVEFLPPVPYREALDEMMRADGLVILQAANCNDQVPAKLYEYLRARRPILALTDPAGDTAHTLRASGITTIAPLDDADAIAQLLRAFADTQRPHDFGLAGDEAVRAASRVGRAEALAHLFDRL